MTQTIKLNLSEANRKGMYDDLCERFGEDEVHDVLENECIQHITQMFDNQDELAERMEEIDNDDI
jgi:hypothetical protein